MSNGSSHSIAWRTLRQNPSLPAKLAVKTPLGGVQQASSNHFRARQFRSTNSHVSFKTALALLPNLLRRRRLSEHQLKALAIGALLAGESWEEKHDYES